MFEVFILAAALGQTEIVDVWFTPKADGTKVRVFVSHDPSICCYELYVDASVAMNWDYTGFDPMGWFESAGMSYRIFEVDPGHSQFPCNGIGQAIGSYYGGASWDSFTGIIGEFTGTPPFMLLPNGCVVEHEPVIVWDGTIPNFERPVNWYFTCPGDADGDRQVGINDFLKVLADWGVYYNNTDFLDILANWGECP